MESHPRSLDHGARDRGKYMCSYNGAKTAGYSSQGEPENEAMQYLSKNHKLVFNAKLTMAQK